MYHPFTIGETVKSAWDILKKNFVTIVVYSAIAVVFIVLIAYVNEFINPDQFGISLLLYLLILLIQGYTTLGLYKLIFTLIDSEYYEFEFSQVLPKFRLVINFVALSFLFAVLAVIYKSFIIEGLLANYYLAQQLIKTIGSLVILYLALRCMFCLCFIADDHSGPLESLRQSFDLTRGYLLKILGILLIIILLIAIPAIISNYIGSPILFGVLLIMIYPFVNIILATTYRKLVYSHMDVDDNISETL